MKNNTVDNPRFYLGESFDSFRGNRLHNRLYFYHAEDDALKYNKGIEHHDPLGMIRAPNGTVRSNYNDEISELRKEINRR